MVRFTRKKIDTLTLGERLKKIRLERRLSLADVSKSTKIQMKYLAFLEDGEYSKLPADVYVKGFLKSYANYLGLSETVLIKQYLREKGIHRNIKKSDDEDKVAKTICFSSFVVTPKIIIASVTVMAVVACFWYLYREVNSFISSPQLFISSPADSSSVNAHSVQVKGIAEKDSLVSINNQPVLVNEKGEFEEGVGLQQGLNTITVKARNRFDKESVKTISVNAIYQSQADAQQQQDGSQQQSQSQSQPFKMEIHVSPNPTWISVEADGNLVYSGVLLPGSTQAFSAAGKISVTSAKGNQTFISLDGKDLGALGGDAGSVQDAVFTSRGKQQ